MTRARPRAAVLGGSAEDIEAAFYEAQQHGDIEQLMSCWAQDEDIVCVHPDGPRLLGTGAIRAAFEAIFCGASHTFAGAQGACTGQCRARCGRTTGNNATGWSAPCAHPGDQCLSQCTRRVAHGVHHASPGGAQDAQNLSDGRPVLH